MSGVKLLSKEGEACDEMLETLIKKYGGGVPANMLVACCAWAIKHGQADAMLEKLQYVSALTEKYTDRWKGRLS